MAAVKKVGAKTIPRVDRNRDARIRDLDGIKNALRYLIEREQSRDLSSSHCAYVNNHLYKPEDEQAAKELIIKFYKPILAGLE